MLQDFEYVHICTHNVVDPYSGLRIQYEDFNCPRCNGQGWYFSMLDNDTQNMYTSDGIYKIAQDIIRKFYDVQTGIVALVGTSSSEQESISNVENRIDEIVNEYKQNQQLLMANENVASQMTDDDLLDTIVIDDIYIDDDTNEMIVSMTLYTVADSALNLSLSSEATQ